MVERRCAREPSAWIVPSAGVLGTYGRVSSNDSGARGDLGKVTRKLRAEQGMTQTQLGDLVGVTAAYISHIEAGKRQAAPSLARRLLEALGAHDGAQKV